MVFFTFDIMMSAPLTHCAPCAGPPYQNARSTQRCVSDANYNAAAGSIARVVDALLLGMLLPKWKVVRLSPVIILYGLKIPIILSFAPKTHRIQQPSQLCIFLTLRQNKPCSKPFRT